MANTLRIGAAALAAALTLTGVRAATAAPAAAGPNAVVATVNGQAITRGQIIDEAIADQVARLRAKNKQVADLTRMPASQFFVVIDAGDLVLSKLAAGSATVSRTELYNAIFTRNSQALADAVQNKIREMVITQAAEAAGIKVPNAEIDKQMKTSIDSVSQQYPELRGKPAAAVFAAFGVRETFIRRNLRVQVMLDKLLRKDLDKRLGHPVGPGDFVEARHILVSAKPAAAAPKDPNAQPEPPSAAATEKAFADGKVKIDQFAAAIKGGSKKFEEIARDQNEDNTKFRDGSLGVFMRGSMVPEFDKAVFGLAKGTVSEPVKTQYGWHLIRVDRTGRDITEKERDQVIQEAIRPRAQTVIEDLTRAAKVRNNLPPQPKAAPRMPTATVDPH